MINGSHRDAAACLEHTVNSAARASLSWAEPQPAPQHQLSLCTHIPPLQKKGAWGKTITPQQQKSEKLPSHGDIPPEPAFTHSKHQAPNLLLSCPRGPCRTLDPRRGKMRSHLTSPATSTARSNNCLPWVYSKTAIVKQRGVRQELKRQKHS